ncbi:hypothetical protein DL98DRAFT_604763 [Cadophora sp. DSE1049]|nr:hypothetical protein DL98DRAFT_604763 [Cadophora sp. DSE1049]
MPLVLPNVNNRPLHSTFTFNVAIKPNTAKVIPTWNYSAVQVYGKATVFFHTSTPSPNAYPSKALDDLAKQSEEGIFKGVVGNRESG